VSAELEDWLSLRGLSLDDAKRRLELSDDELERDVPYEGLTGLTLAHNPEHPGYFYFRDGELAMLHVEEPTGLDLGSLLESLGEPDARLRSRAGKRFTDHVWADRGVAVSTDGNEIAFLEVFPPRSLERYEREIYEDPGEFIR
jgi:hypothetical protein